MPKSGSTQVHRKSHPKGEDLEQALEVAIVNVGCKIEANPGLCEPQMIRIVTGAKKLWGRKTQRTVNTHAIKRTWRGRRYLRLECQLGVFGVTTKRELIRFYPKPIAEQFEVMVADPRTGAAVPLDGWWWFAPPRKVEAEDQLTLLHLLEGWYEAQSSKKKTAERQKQY